MWIALLALTLIDGLVTRNPYPSVAPIRAGLVAAIFLLCLWRLWKRGVRVSLGTGVVIGILAALTVADAYQQTVLGLSLWLVYAAVYATLRAAPRDSSSHDLALFGVILSALVLMMLVIPHPREFGVSMWNRNSTGGLLAVTLPAAFMLAGWRRIAAMAVIGASVLVSGSRGAILGAAAGIAVLIQPWFLLGAPLLILGLCLLRRHETMVRFLYFAQGLELIGSSPIWGVGPRYLIAGDSHVEIHVHNSLLGLAAQVGAVGMLMITATISIMRRVIVERWRLAALAVVAAHSLVDDPLTWLPLGVVIAVIIAGFRYDG
jgi:small basic protein